MSRRTHRQESGDKEVRRSHSSLDLRSEGKKHGLQFRSGPLPLPDDFARYDEVHPGTAERLLAMAEKEQSHRHELESAESSHDRDQDRRGLRWGGILTLSGMICALIALLSVLGAGVWLIVHGHPIGGYTALVTATVAIIGVFVQSTHTARKSRANEKQGPED